MTKKKPEEPKSRRPHRPTRPKTDENAQTNTQESTDAKANEPRHPKPRLNRPL
jgi:hypothetical protein